jgi:hypothetical protein
MNSLPATVQNFLNSSPYHPCLLLVHPRIERLQAVADELLSAYGWPSLSIGRELSEALLLIEPKRRPQKAARWLEDRVNDFKPGPLLCTDIDLLFEPSLTLNPMTLLQSASRITRLVTLWPGTYEQGTLAYAVPEHAHYRTWRNPQLPIEALP